eukprot:gene31203-53470_t
MPQGVTLDVLVRVIVGITLFAAAYMAEIIRGGLQAIPKGQLEAADTLGLSYWQTQRKIVLPQALAMVVPSMMNNFISVFKDTSLVTIVSLFELSGALALALNSDVDWRPFKIEAYIFITLPVGRKTTQRQQGALKESCMSDPIIRFDKVNKWYGNDFHVLRDINMTVQRGERIVICGPSGSGKSTLIR